MALNRHLFARRAAHKDMQPDARFSTYSGAPSIQPSLAPTLDSTTYRSPSQQGNARYSEQAFLRRESISEKPASTPLYGNMGPAAHGSTLTLSSSTDPRAADLQSFASALDKMNEPRLDKQRYVMSGNKTEEVSKTALGAKVERALSRRMTGQDAVFTSKPKTYDEKAFEAAVSAN
jgi:hypothetical protein